MVQASASNVPWRPGKRADRKFPNDKAISKCRPSYHALHQFTTIYPPETDTHGKVSLMINIQGFEDDSKAHMPLRPNALCSRTLARPTTATGDAIWITDDILNWAIQRFSNVFEGT